MNTAMNTATRTIKRLALAMACIGLLTLSSAQQAGAMLTHGGDAGDAAQVQADACNAMGGEVGYTRSPELTVANQNDPPKSTTITCTGGMGGGWGCVNAGNTSSCSPLGAPLPPSGEFDPSIIDNGEVLDDSGSVAPPAGSDIGDDMENMTWQVLNTKTPADSPSVSAPDDNQDQDANHSKNDKKNKKGKKGKKGGKGRSK
jgi:hypothetical protein